MALTLVCAACVTPSAQVSYGAGPATVGAGPSGSWLDATDRGWGRRGWAAPVPGYGRGLTERPVVVCDTFGRCWRQEQPVYGRHHGYYGSRPPWVTRRDGWSHDRLFGRHGWPEDRFVGTDRRVVCDRGTGICYKRGEIDKSETEDVFGERAGDRADDLRDKFGTARLFVPKRGVACDRNSRVCFDDGEPDRRLTRRYFGGRRGDRDRDD